MRPPNDVAQIVALREVQKILDMAGVCGKFGLGYNVLSGSAKPAPQPRPGLPGSGLFYFIARIDPGYKRQLAFRGIFSYLLDVDLLTMHLFIGVQGLHYQVAHGGPVVDGGQLQAAVFFFVQPYRPWFLVAHNLYLYNIFCIKSIELIHKKT